tara:strand:- start:3689 stop:3820 length:132 start_codon:yes stop_codon:yes gene_type:complete
VPGDMLSIFGNKFLVAIGSAEVYSRESAYARGMAEGAYTKEVT